MEGFSQLGSKSGQGGQGNRPFVTDLEAIRRGLCDEAKEQTCREECSDDDGELKIELLTYRCGKCEKKKQSDLNEYTIKIFKIRQLKMAGYPFGANDLTLEEWLDLGQVEESMKWQTKTPSQ